jgi:hypothetical protein
MRKSGLSLGTSSSFSDSILRPNLVSHSGPERYVMVAICRASFMPL